MASKSNDTTTFSITNTTKGKLPSLPFEALKEDVLGKKYELSLVIVSDKRSKELNATYRDKNHPTNVLSFELSKTEGEIFLNLAQIKREEKLFGVSGKKLVAHMFIHGLFHLKGLDHGSTMDEHERDVRARFNF